MNQQNYSVEVLVNGHPVKEYSKDGKIFIEGRKGNEFSINIKNNGCKRILAVPTIDGLSVLSGKDASLNSQGYIVDGYSSLTIDGWRTSDKEIAKFYFTDPEDSYSERTGRKDNLGVIGVAVFREKEKPVCSKPICPEPWFPNYPWWQVPRWYNCDDATISTTTTTTSSDSHSSADSVNLVSNSKTFSQDIGTGFGGRKESRVTGVEFDKEFNPDAVFTIFYNTKEQLEKIGINFREKPKYVAPQAFPNGFCEPPK